MLTTCLLTDVVNKFEQIQEGGESGLEWGVPK